MPTDPNNTRYPAQYNQGEDGWGSGMSNNLDNLDVDVPQVGPLADRPDPTADQAPKFWYATGEGEYRQYVNTGTSWNAMDARVRLLSTFSSVQAAVDWSKNNAPKAATVIVDGDYQTDEGTITLPNRVILRGLGCHNSRIITTSSTTDPVFEYPDNINTLPLFSDITFHNDGAAGRPFFKCAVDPFSFSGFLGTRFKWENLYIRDYGGTYPVDVANCWGGSMENVHVNSRSGSPNGLFRFINSNACYLDSLRATYCQSEDGETPAIYATGCTGTHFSAPHVENIETDAALQIAGSGSQVSVSGLHLEPHNYNINAAIQIGDGGLTDGNTAGAVDDSPMVQILGGVVHGNNSEQMEGIRHLGGDLSIIGLRIFDPANGISQYLHYGGSNHDSITTSPERAVIMGMRDVTITNSSGSPANILNLSGKTYQSETTAADNLTAHELAWVENSTGTHSIVKQDGSGTNHVWDPDRTI